MIALAPAVALTTLATSVVADEDEDQMRSLIDDAGPIAMVFIIILGVALFFLWRSMTKQMKKIDPSLPDDDEVAAEDDNGRADDRDGDVPSSP